MFSDPKQLFELLPAWLRQRDARAGGTLAQLIGVIGAQAVLLDQDLDRMYANWFVETCDDWVVPYLGDLLGYAPMPGAAALDARTPRLAQVFAPRREVGNLIAQRRRKGTLAMLAELARDQASWPALAVEFHAHVAAAQHLDHPHPKRLATTDIRAAAAPAPCDVEALSPQAHLADVRRIGNPQSQGLYALTNVGLFAFRAQRFGVTRTAAYCREDIGGHCYTFSALGDDLPLWRDPMHEGDALPSGIDDVPFPITPAALEAPRPDADGRFSADPSLYGAGRAFVIEVRDWPARGVNGPVAAGRVLPADLSRWSGDVPKGFVAVDPGLGRLMFRPGNAPEQDVVVSYGYGGAMALGGGTYLRPPLALPASYEISRVRSSEAGPPGDGEFGDIGSAIDAWQKRRAQAGNPAGAAGGEGAPFEPAALVVELADSGIYRGRPDIDLAAGQSVFLVAGPATRPVLWLSDDNPGASDFLTVRGDTGSRFVIDGVMVAGRGLSFGPSRAAAQLPIVAGAPARHDAADAGSGARRDLCQIVIRHSTLVPGWAYWRGNASAKHAEPSLVLDGTTVSVLIEHSIVGAIRVFDGSSERDATPLLIRDSIVDALAPAHAAIAGPPGRAALARLSVVRSTVVGTVLADSIACAENSLFVSHVSVARRQRGCMRFCYAPSGSRTPRRYGCQPDAAIGADAAAAARAAAGAAVDPAARAELAQLSAERVAPVFVSTRYGTPGYLRLAVNGPSELATGADDEAELGVYHDLFEAQRLDLLSARLAEFTPADVDSAVIFAT
ncbi:hypothetical protein FSB08_17160 [Paraburkholderia sp. JPY432]|uniref:hypothetical protein n=1 Tax=Paraburkholderia youngii TaxID=2782701 RepID=UPI001595B708|nr:hypothetical protein [Paraburkholderia youngii]NVH74232.1 hypothetical protein [Paraburkholderia youngii]